MLSLAYNQASDFEQTQYQSLAHSRKNTWIHINHHTKNTLVKEATPVLCKNMPVMER